MEKDGAKNWIFDILRTEIFEPAKAQGLTLSFFSIEYVHYRVEDMKFI